MIVHVYLETSIKWPKQSDGIIGIVFTDQEDVNRKSLFGVVQNASEHEAVLIGINRALTYLSEYDTIHIHVSSTVGYSFKYLEKWQASGFVGAKGCKVKHAKIWEEISEKSKGKTLKMHINERNGYRNWLTNECDMRGRKHGYIL